MTCTRILLCPLLFPVQSHNYRGHLVDMKDAQQVMNTDYEALAFRVGTDGEDVTYRLVLAGRKQICSTEQLRGGNCCIQNVPIAKFYPQSFRTELKRSETRRGSWSLVVLFPSLSVMNMKFQLNKLNVCYEQTRVVHFLK